MQAVHETTLPVLSLQLSACGATLCCWAVACQLFIFINIHYGLLLCFFMCVSVVATPVTTTTTTRPPSKSPPFLTVGTHWHTDG